MHNTQNNLIKFIHQELDVPYGSLDMAIRQSETSLGSIPMILWQYGLINLQQLDQILGKIEYCDF